MRIPQKIALKLRKIRFEMLPPPHKVKIDKKAETSYADLKRRIVGLAQRHLNAVEWIYRHELLHLDRYPRTFAKELYWSAKIYNRLHPNIRDFFKRRRSDVMNMAEDAVIDYRIGREYRDALNQIEKYLKGLNDEVLSDPPPHEMARLIVARRINDRLFERLLEEEDIVQLGVLAAEWLYRHRQNHPSRDVCGKPTREDYEEAAGELIAEGEDIEPIDEFARENGVNWRFDRAALIALVKSYDWYLSASKALEIHKGSRARQTVWNPGDDVQKLDVNGSLTVFPKVIPGLTAVKREPRNVEGYEVPTGFKDIAILVDESGSMRDAGKTRAVRKVGVSLLAYMNRRRIQFMIVGFGQYATVRVPLGFNYIEGVRYFALKYRGWQETTEIAPALPLLNGRRLLVYVISDAEIFDLHKVQLRENIISEVVLVLINYTKDCGEFVKAFGKVPVRGYWVNPSKVDSFIVQELGRLS